jgi:hypothetical protein
MIPHTTLSTSFLGREGEGFIENTRREDTEALPYKMFK